MKIHILVYQIKNIIYFCYLKIFGRRKMQRFNNILFDLALRAKGYGNSKDMRVSGEQYFLMKLMQTEPTLCIDVGANKGKYSRYILENSNSNIIAFEPYPLSYKYLSKIRDIYPQRFECFNVGVGDKSKIATLNYGINNTELASFCDNINDIPYVKESNTYRMDVHMVTLDSKIESIRKYGDKIDLLKIDAEGFEYEIISGALELINNFSPKYIQIEFNWHHLFRNQTLLLISKLIPNYRALIMLPFEGGQVEINLDSGECNLFVYQNIIFELK